MCEMLELRFNPLARTLAGRRCLSFSQHRCPLSVKVSDLSRVTFRVAQESRWYLVLWMRILFLVPSAKRGTRNGPFTQEMCHSACSAVDSAPLVPWSRRGTLSSSPLCMFLLCPVCVVDGPDAIYLPTNLPLNHIHRRFFP